MNQSTNLARQLQPEAQQRGPAPGQIRLPSPEALIQRLSLSSRAMREVHQARARIFEGVRGLTSAPLAVVGPCSIHCETAALEYAERLARLAEGLGDRVQLAMRVYFEKPRTTVGWKGFLYDPDLDGKNDLGRGLERARRLLVQIAEMGVPIATELLDPLVAPYFEDCLSWVAIGARTSESQIHRQLASGLSCPVGFKNGTDGSLKVALDAIESASVPHSRLGVGADGHVALLETGGNQASHLVLRGGTSGPNFDEQSVRRAVSAARERGLDRRILIDCSHDNSGKDYRRQGAAFMNVLSQLDEDGSPVLGMMLESHLQGGRQSLGHKLRYGVSVTDACIGFNETEELLSLLAESRPRRRASEPRSQVEELS